MCVFELMNFPEFEINYESPWVSIDYVRDFKAKVAKESPPQIFPISLFANEVLWRCYIDMSGCVWKQYTDLKQFLSYLLWKTFCL